MSERDESFEVYNMGADCSVVRNVTQKPSHPDQNPSWQARYPTTSGSHLGRLGPTPLARDGT
jgi:hypothetical protein